MQRTVYVYDNGIIGSLYNTVQYVVENKAKVKFLDINLPHISM